MFANDPKRRQLEFNTASRNQWERFAPHRQKVSSLLGAGKEPANTRLCVLGAGNCNDLDLSALLKAHREVYLVDLDQRALERGSAQQRVIDHPALRLLGDVDVSCVFDLIRNWSASTPISPEDLLALADWPSQRLSLALPGPFDVVASCCLLSQLVNSIYWTAGVDHPRFMELIQAVRAGHLRLMSRLAGPDGVAVLVTDVVSSETFPTLESVPESALAGLLPQLVQTRNFIHGMHPAVLMSVLRKDSVLSTTVKWVETAPPWRWKLHERVYLVCAITFGADDAVRRIRTALTVNR